MWTFYRECSKVLGNQEVRAGANMDKQLNIINKKKDGSDNLTTFTRVTPPRE